MNQFHLETPITFIFFNRQDTTLRVMETIRKEKPEKLYLVSDGARENRPGEAGIVEALRRQVEEMIDWTCEVHKNYAPQNMGCYQRMYTGISWTLSNEESTIILEDDIIPVPTFFRFCQELLQKYKDTPEVFYISGNNIYQQFLMNESYAFSDFPSIWGWATWRRAWEQYESSMEAWIKIRDSGTIERCYGRKWAKFYKNQIELAYTGERDTWDYQWEASRMWHHGLGIIPQHNMIENIGFDRADATHTKGSSIYDFTKQDMHFPLIHPNTVSKNQEYDKGYLKQIISREFERLTFWGKVRRRLRMLNLYHKGN